MALPPNWRVAESIRQLHHQLRPLAPGAPATSFGAVADGVHGTASDHYPKIYPGLGSQPVVTAGDFPLAERLDPWAVLDTIRQSKDPRVKYGISRGQMFSSYPTPTHPAWTWRPYSGADGHFEHGHLSVIGDARADDTTPWLINLGGTVALSADQEKDIWEWIALLVSGSTEPRASDRFKFRPPFAATNTTLARLEAALAAATVADEVRDKAVLAAITAITTNGGPDAAPIVAAINTVRDEARVEYARLHDELAAVRAENTALRERLAAAARAEADQLDDE